jgi:hypothetical protein
MAHSADLRRRSHDLAPNVQSSREDSEKVYAVAGVPGPSGPRTGISWGKLPGNSSGLGDWPGSRMGGGVSGNGLPGGSSCGGSVGCPGLIGGSSCGSIGIYMFTLRLSPMSGRVPVAAAVAIFT